MTLCRASHRFFMPLFCMKTRAVAIFPAADTNHGTVTHHPKWRRRAGCEAHLSCACQTPAFTLGVRARSAEYRAVHERLLRLGAGDARRLPGAVWLPVWHLTEEPPPDDRMSYDPKLMRALPWTVIVLYNVENNEPLVIYLADGGVENQYLLNAHQQFNFLHNEWRFGLHRQKSGCSSHGCLHVDGQGCQLMQMLGVREQGRNVDTRPDGSRPEHEVANPTGDLDCYVVHFDHAWRFGGPQVKPLFNHLAERVHAILPTASAALVEALNAAKVRERLYSKAAEDTMSDDLLISNVGMSAAYQNPPHKDRNDAGWTPAFSLKCSYPCCASLCGECDDEGDSSSDDDGGDCVPLAERMSCLSHGVRAGADPEPDSDVEMDDVPLTQKACYVRHVVKGS